MPVRLARRGGEPSLNGTTPRAPRAKGRGEVSFEELLIVAAAAMLIVLAVSRPIRVHFGRTPHPAGKARPLTLLVLLLMPPIVLEAAILRPATSAAQLHILGSVLIYVAALAGFSLLMGIAALIVNVLARGRSRRLLMLALVGSEGDPDAVLFDPPLTPELAADVGQVQRANAAFPRGSAFPLQIDLAGFRDDWDALDAATRALEGHIDRNRHLGVAVAYEATETAADARSRLETLRRLAIDQGQAWAGR